MAGRLLKLLSVHTTTKTQIRQKYTRGKPPSIARTLQQRIEEMEYKDPELYYKVDIGFAVPKQSRTEITKIWIKEMQERRKNRTLQKSVDIDMDKLKEDSYLVSGSKYFKRIAEHFGIYQDLYGDAYFYPVLPLTVDYDFGDEEYLARVYNGNLIQSYEAKNAPFVHYNADPNSLWTLLLTTPDGNFSNPENEYCHWFIGNIPGNDISKGQQLIDYIRPFPAKGIGFCRYIFVLYKQDKELDFSDYKKEQPNFSLSDRNWKTYDFIRRYQDYITPAGLAFFQSDYDDSLKEFYHNTLNMMEPKFEYDFPKPYLKPQKWFPIKEPFNLYMDKYRDPKQINKEFLLRKLKKVHPFKYPEPPLKYPNAHVFKGYLPSWLKTEIRKERLGQGRINEYK